MDISPFRSGKGPTGAVLTAVLLMTLGGTGGCQWASECTLSAVHANTNELVTVANALSEPMKSIRSDLGSTLDDVRGCLEEIGRLASAHRSLVEDIRENGLRGRIDVRFGMHSEQPDRDKGVPVDLRLPQLDDLGGLLRSWTLFDEYQKQDLATDLVSTIQEARKVISGAQDWMEAVELRLPKPDDLGRLLRSWTLFDENQKQDLATDLVSTIQEARKIISVAQDWMETTEGAAPAVRSEVSKAVLSLATLSRKLSEEPVSNDLTGGIQRLHRVLAGLDDFINGTERIDGTQQYSRDHGTGGIPGSAEDPPRSQARPGNPGGDAQSPGGAQDMPMGAGLKGFVARSTSPLNFAIMAAFISLCFAAVGLANLGRRRCEDSNYLQGAPNTPSTVLKARNGAQDFLDCYRYMWMANAFFLSVLLDAGYLDLLVVVIFVTALLIATFYRDEVRTVLDPSRAHSNPQPVTKWLILPISLWWFIFAAGALTICAFVTWGVQALLPGSFSDPGNGLGRAVVLGAPWLLVSFIALLVARFDRLDRSKLEQRLKHTWIYILPGGFARKYEIIP